MSRSGICKKCSKQSNCFEKEGELFCSELCYYNWFQEENRRRQEEEEEEERFKLERWEEI